MGELKDKAKGLANEAAGNVKQAVAKHQNDPKLHEEGVKQERKGEAQQLPARSKARSATRSDA